MSNGHNGKIIGHLEGFNVILITNKHFKEFSEAAQLKLCKSLMTPVHLCHKPVNQCCLMVFSMVLRMGMYRDGQEYHTD